MTNFRGGITPDHGLLSATCYAVGVAALRRLPALFAARPRPVIPVGPDTSSDKLRQCARCTACGRRGATIQRPSWSGAGRGSAALKQLRDRQKTGVSRYQRRPASIKQRCGPWLPSNRNRKDGLAGRILHDHRRPAGHRRFACPNFVKQPLARCRASASPGNRAPSRSSTS